MKPHALSPHLCYPPAMPHPPPSFLLRLWRRPRTRRIRVKRNAPPPPAFAAGEIFHFCGRDYPLQITVDAAAPQGCTLTADELFVNFPATLNAREQRAETRIELLLWYKRQARAHFRARLDHWAEHLGVRYGRLIVTSPERRWGSCNYRNDIRLTWRLMLTPPDLIDYVIAHELCHVQHKNHGKHFWAQLASIMPDWKARRQALRQWENHNW